jgi:hypothetical protein
MELVIVRPDLRRLDFGSSSCSMRAADTAMAMLKVLSIVVVTFGSAIVAGCKCPPRHIHASRSFTMVIPKEQLDEQLDKADVASKRIMRHVEWVFQRRRTPEPDSSEHQLRLPYNNTPDILSRRFFGRRKYVSRIRSRLCTRRGHNCSVAVLYGHPGVGKTQLALRYVRRYAQRYKVILWISADKPEKIENSYATAASKIRLPGCGFDISSGKRMQNMLSWMEGTGGYYADFLESFADMHIPDR